jgi:cytochrome P450
VSRELRAGVTVATEGLEAQLAAFFAGDRAATASRYALYDRLRADAPVTRFGTSTAILARHADVKAAYLDPVCFRSPDEALSRFDERYARLSEQEVALYEEIVAFARLFISRQNGDVHRRYRAAMQRAFTPRRIEELHTTVQRVIDAGLGRLARGGVVDFMQLAFRAPLLVITHLLGAPVEDADRIKYFGDTLLASFALSPLDPAAVREGHRALHDYRAYAAELIARNRREQRRSSLVALLLDAEDEDRLEYEELVATFIHLLFAGHETTANLFGSALVSLLADRAQWELVCADPSLVPGAVEEVLRYEPPAQLTPRVTAEPVEIDGVELAEGTSILLGNGAANRDPAMFSDPHCVDVTRRPNDHLGLGHGAHFCLGASLARLEGRVLLETVSRRFPDLALAADPAALDWAPHPRLRGLRSLPVRLGRDRG